MLLVCVSSIVIDEIKRIIKSSEIMKCVSTILYEAGSSPTNTCKGGRWEMAHEEQRWKTRVGDSIRERAHIIRGTIPVRTTLCST